MQLKANAVITGFTKFAGEIDGQKIDANTIYVEVDFGEKSGKGKRTAPRKCLEESVIKKVEHLSFPMQAELTMELTASSKKESLIVTEIKPLNVSRQATAA